ncbi:MAG TPA: acyl carrier protein [Haloplasmataceae bacterium]
MVLEKVIEIVANELSVPKDELNENTNLQDDLNADSLDAVELIMAIEDEFGIEISDDDAQSLRTIGDIVNYINKVQG